MDNKDLMTPGNDSLNLLTTQDLPIELAELSEEDLSQVKGGGMPCFCCLVWPDDRLTFYPHVHLEISVRAGGWRDRDDRLTTFYPHADLEISVIN